MNGALTAIFLDSLAVKAEGEAQAISKKNDAYCDLSGVMTLPETPTNLLFHVVSSWNDVKHMLKHSKSIHIFC